MEKYIKDIANHYFIAALWSSTDSNDRPLDDQFCIDDIATETKLKAYKDIERFLFLAGDSIDDIDTDMIGHDFWLTRCGHGAGFWDRGYSPSIEADLLEAVAEFSELTPIQGDSGLIYFE